MRDVFLEKHLVEIPDRDIESHGRDNSAVVQRVFPRVRESDTLIVRLEILRERNVGSQDCFSRTSRFVRDSGGFNFPLLRRSINKPVRRRPPSARFTQGIWRVAVPAHSCWPDFSFLCLVAGIPHG
jgi:hypothetical protein